MRMTLNDPLVEPEHPPTIMIAKRKSFKYSGHILKSSVTKPVVVLMDTTVKAALRNAWLASPVAETRVRPQVTNRIPTRINAQ